MKNYNIEDINSTIESRYSQIPSVSFDLDFDKEDTIFLLFGTIHLSKNDIFKRTNEKIFYFSAFGRTPEILKVYKFIGKCGRIYYSLNSPQNYGKKDISTKMENVKLGVFKTNLDSYISIWSSIEIGIIELIFDYLDSYISLKNP